MAKSPDSDHVVRVWGVWHNDDTTGVEVYCSTCEQSILSGDELTVEQIIEAVDRHNTTSGSVEEGHGE